MTAKTGRKYVSESLMAVNLGERQDSFMVVPFRVLVMMNYLVICSRVEWL